MDVEIMKENEEEKMSNTQKFFALYFAQIPKEMLDFSQV